FQDLAAGASRATTFTYTVSDGSTTDTATVTVTVTGRADDPTAVADSATVAEGAAATAIDVLANDTDPDGGPKTIQSATERHSRAPPTPPTPAAAPRPPRAPPTPPTAPWR